MKVKKPQKGVMVLPSLFSLTNLFFGFMSVLLTFQGRYRMAAFLIIIAALMDGLDGLVARATHTPSDFGVELDSLADAVSFGLATSVLLYFWGMEMAGPPAVFFSFIFLTAGVLRLARYNVRSRVPSDRKHYQGLTVPSAAMFMAAVVNFHPVPLATRQSGFLVAVLTLIVSLCMVSTFPYRNFVKAFIGHRIEIRTALFLAISLFGVLFYTRIFLLLYFGLNVVSGPTVALVRAFRKHPRKKPEPKIIPS
ncbi:MAG TPA: CDP-diacylglycerol--serine O-phosphatidyltransferase [Candidatus Latescibacteria bacterium]|nr:CDP-diacylglycerol--serine O-phosphatidyltransferase [Candidatus Latescibacterota bacterium]